MNKSLHHLIVAILKNHLRIFKNWFFYDQNKIIVFFSIFLLFIFISQFSIYFHEQNNPKSQFIIFAFTFLAPIYCSKVYLRFITKEENYLKIFYNNIDLIYGKRILIIFATFIIYGFILILGFVPKLFSINIYLIITLQVIVLTFFSWFLPIVKFEIRISKSYKKENAIWNFKIKTSKCLPMRGIILREFLSLWRERKGYLLKILLNVIFINMLLLLFIVNNQKNELLNYLFIFQSFLIPSFILNYSTSNNILLNDSIPCSKTSILKGEYIFWLLMFFIYFMILVLVYMVLSLQVSLFFISISIFTFMLILGYVLFLRLIYLEEEILRTLNFIMLFIPITLPFIVYHGYRKIRC